MFRKILFFLIILLSFIFILFNNFFKYNNYNNKNYIKNLVNKKSKSNDITIYNNYYILEERILEKSYILNNDNYLIKINSNICNIYLIKWNKDSLYITLNTKNYLILEINNNTIESISINNIDTINIYMYYLITDINIDCNIKKNINFNIYVYKQKSTIFKITSTLYPLNINIYSEYDFLVREKHIINEKNHIPLTYYIKLFEIDKIVLFCIHNCVNVYSIDDIPIEMFKDTTKKGNKTKINIINNLYLTFDNNLFLLNSFIYKNINFYEYIRIIKIHNIKNISEEVYISLFTKYNYLIELYINGDINTNKKVFNPYKIKSINNSYILFRLYYQIKIIQIGINMNLFNLPDSIKDTLWSFNDSVVPKRFSEINFNSNLKYKRVSKMNYSNGYQVFFTSFIQHKLPYIYQSSNIDLSKYKRVYIKSFNNNFSIIKNHFSYQITNDSIFQYICQNQDLESIKLSNYIEKIFIYNDINLKNKESFYISLLTNYSYLKYIYINFEYKFISDIKNINFLKNYNELKYINISIKNNININNNLYFSYRDFISNNFYCIIKINELNFEGKSYFLTKQKKNIKQIKLSHNHNFVENPDNKISKKLKEDDLDKIVDIIGYK